MRWGRSPGKPALLAAGVVATGAMMLAGCTTADDGGPRAPTLQVPASTMPEGATTSTPRAPTATRPEGSASAVPEESASTTPDGASSPRPTPDMLVAGPARPATAEVAAVATGLPAPWGLARLPGGELLVTLRDEARVVVVDPDGGGVLPVQGPGAEQLRQQTRPGGEGGLLGIAVRPSDPASGPATVWLYRTGEHDNAVVRGDLVLEDGRAELGDLTTVLDGIPRAGNHNGGRLAFGPDGFLYVTTGDAGDRPTAQDPASLGGKILRVTPDGDAAPGNPVAGSPVWSLGHRNVQGIAWTTAGRMLASEFGQNTWDELNEILPGGNYGWPGEEGAGADAQNGVPVTGAAVVGGLVRPMMVWRTADASPSGIAVTISAAGPDDAVYLASLRGQRLWRVPLTETGEERFVVVGPPQALLEGEGRLRDVVADADGSLWVLTNNTDGRGVPGPDDDRLLHVVITPE